MSAHCMRNQRSLDSSCLLTKKGFSLWDGYVRDSGSPLRQASPGLKGLSQRANCHWDPKGTARWTSFQALTVFHLTNLCCPSSSSTSAYNSPALWVCFHWNSFPAKFRYWRLVKLPVNWGMSPVKWFLLKLRLNNRLKITSSTGLYPLNSLESSLRNSSCDNFPSSAGISPEILFPSTCKLVRLWHSPHSGESSPENRLPLREIKLRLGWTPNALEMSPVNWFPSRRTRNSLVQFIKHSGNGPVKLLPSFTVKCWKAKPLLNPGGNSPENLLLAKLTFIKLGLFSPSSVGMVPKKLLANTESVSSLLRSDNVSGSSPCNLLVLRSRTVSDVRFPISGGTVPLRLFS